MSKRDEGAAISYFMEGGYLPEAVTTTCATSVELQPVRRCCKGNPDFQQRGSRCRV
ncbi:MAG: hypothetical protein U0528_18990 [Anaerolineae bacterium]